MSTIRVVYHGHEPSFPATDQHPDAVRYFDVGENIVSLEEWKKLDNKSALVNAVDVIFGPPTREEINAFLNPSKE